MKSAALWAMALVATIGVAARAGAQEVAEGKFKNSQDKDVGTVHIEHMPSATLLMLDLHDMPPGVHGIHIHSVAKCDPPGFETAGPHFNPTGSQHGMKNPKGPHAGDLPNITIPASGKLQTTIMVAATMQGDGSGGMIDGDGASLVIHASPDDYMTDPAGNSGARIACAKLFLPEREN